MPSGQAKERAVQLMDRGIRSAFAVAWCGQGQTRIETPADGDRDGREPGTTEGSRKPGRSPETEEALLVGDGSDAEVARGAHTSSV
ncbi:hypothetical protein GCM10010259_21490 [Streptomyces daghestanicus]|uniref:Transposase n=1 Tax=Streptomyces daghestanicus TaxID=66885 RepID=A0ABQ3Q6V1_9ACTN|nr:hypothetical protein GCM10010240_20860 [Streptomyces griseoviridis]GGU30655.1 hypothetical protein GCM10010259_21490 [Streptomyces daghestanicus]GHI32990.1 hypothetical protein Sdagh_47200 [Streptomyces daghestanicus]